MWGTVLMWAYVVRQCKVGLVWGTVLWRTVLRLLMWGTVLMWAYVEDSVKVGLFGGQC